MHPLLNPSQACPSGLAFFLAENPLRFFTSFIFRMRRDIRGLTRVSSVPIFVVTIKLRGSHARRKAGRAKAASGEARIGFYTGNTGRLTGSSAGVRYSKSGGRAVSARRRDTGRNDFREKGRQN